MKIVDKKSKYRSVRISGDVFFTILTIVVLIGAFVGSLYYREISAMDFVETFSVADSFYDYKTMSFWGNFFCSFLKNTIIMLIILISGMCIIGQPICVTALFYKGVSVGTALTIIYSCNDMKNFLIAVLHILIDAIVSTFVLVLASKEGIKLSNKLFKLGINNRIEDDFNKNIKLYLLKFIVLFAIIILLSLFQSILSVFIG